MTVPTPAQRRPFGAVLCACNILALILALLEKRTGLQQHAIVD